MPEIWRGNRRAPYGVCDGARRKPYGTNRGTATPVETPHSPNANDWSFLTSSHS
nr:MAG TPA: hypothetical protein [Caudoviricetes sp.]